MFEKIQLAFDMYDISLQIIAAVIGLVAVRAFIRWLLGKEVRLFKNLKRPVMFISTDEKTRSDLEEVQYYLSQCGLFNCGNPVGNGQRVDMIKNHYSRIFSRPKN